MNKNRIAMLVLIISITGLVGWAVGKSVLGGNKLKPVDVQSARALSTDIVTPSASIFNTNAINPTTAITISQNNQNLIGN